MVPLHKKTGGVRPLAVRCTLHRLVAQIESRMVKNVMDCLLSPKQLGFGVRGGAEAAVHAARRFLSRMAACRQCGCEARLPAHNAFNSIHHRIGCWRPPLSSLLLISFLLSTPHTPLPPIFIGMISSSCHLSGHSRVTLWGFCYSV